MTKARKPFPYSGEAQLAVSPLHPPDSVCAKTMILSLFKEILANDFIIDSESPQNKDDFLMVFRHYKWWEDEDPNAKVSHITTSESQGYGMMMTAYMAGCEDYLGLIPDEWIFGSDSLQDYYNAMLRTVLKFHSVYGENNRLFAWELFGYPKDGGNRTGYKQADGYKTAPFTKTQSGTCATDGDMDIIFSLFLADNQWGSSSRYNYKQIALDMLVSLWEFCVDKDSCFLLVGDWASGRTTVIRQATRLSDIIPSHLKVYEKFDKSFDWGKVVKACYDVFADLNEKNGAKNGLLPDFAIKTNKGWEAPPGKILEADDGSYSYNACRVPWRLGVNYLLFGDSPVGSDSLYKSIIAPLNIFAKNYCNGDLEKLCQFQLDGTAFGDPDPDVFTAPFLVTAVSGDNRDWVDLLWNWKGLTKYNGDNYGDYIKLFSMLSAAGYIWSPD